MMKSASAALRRTAASKHGGGGSARLIVLKASDRAAVHGAKPPQVDVVDKEKVEEDIENAKQEKERKRKEIEETVDSQLQNCNAPVLTHSSSKNA